MKAIVYTSNTGSTARYAKLLGHETGLPVYTSETANRNLPAGAEIIYLGWIMASEIKGYKKAAKQYTVQAVCGVGMGQTGTQVMEVRKKNAIPDSIPLFTLQGNFHMDRLHGVYKLMMGVMVRTAGKALAEKTDRTPEEDDMLDMMFHDGERVRPENLSDVLNWYREQH
nr:hypothetical protein [uncultured Oscillibacter sp.]